MNATESDYINRTKASRCSPRAAFNERRLRIFCAGGISTFHSKTSPQNSANNYQVSKCLSERACGAIQTYPKIPIYSDADPIEIYNPCPASALNSGSSHPFWLVTRNCGPSIAYSSTAWWLDSLVFQGSLSIFVSERMCRSDVSVI